MRNSEILNPSSLITNYSTKYGIREKKLEEKFSNFLSHDSSSWTCQNLCYKICCRFNQQLYLFF